MGSGGMVVMDEDNCMVDVARYFVEFTQFGVVRQVRSLPRRTEQVPAHPESRSPRARAASSIWTCWTN